jgi:hypothetical protein
MISNIDDPFGILDTVDNVSPIESLPPEGIKEHRNEIRYSATWKVVVVAKNHAPYHAKIKDISLHGTAILIDRNLKPDLDATLHIYLHSLDGPDAPKILTVHGKTAYTIHDAKELCFRVGFVFVKFELAADRAYLESRLTNHHPKAP